MQTLVSANYLKKCNKGKQSRRKNKKNEQVVEEEETEIDIWWWYGGEKTTETLSFWWREIQCGDVGFAEKKRYKSGGGGGGEQAEHNKSEREIKEKWDDGATQIFPRLKPIALRWKVIDLSWDLSLEAILMSS